jgi:hypothetical protein
MFNAGPGARREGASVLVGPGIISDGVILIVGSQKRFLVIVGNI